MPQTRGFSPRALPTAMATGITRARYPAMLGISIRTTAKQTDRASRVSRGWAVSWATPPTRVSENQAAAPVATSA